MSASSPEPAFDRPQSGAARSPIAHLLHAMNQPLTGLQCSLELAASGPRPTDYYIRTLEEGLELVARMRVLVEALREIAELQGTRARESVLFRLDVLLSQIAAELEPVAAIRGIRLHVFTSPPVFVHSDRTRISALLFRWIDSVLGIARPNSDLRAAATVEQQKASIAVSWVESEPQMDSPFSRAEIGLLIAQAGWEQAGATWSRDRHGNIQTCAIRLPLASSSSHPTNIPQIGDMK